MSSMFQKCAASWIIKNKFEAIHNWDFLGKKQKESTIIHALKQRKSESFSKKTLLNKFFVVLKHV